LALLSERFVTLGRRLDGSVKAYNEAVGTLEGRVLVSARRFEEHGVASDGEELKRPAPVEISARRIQAPEVEGGEPAGELPAAAEELL
jgi:DNA recombination protein RmuC